LKEAAAERTMAAAGTGVAPPKAPGELARTGYVWHRRLPVCRGRVQCVWHPQLHVPLSLRALQRELLLLLLGRLDLGSDEEVDACGCTRYS
jgi:hypothetical protein